MEKPPHKKKQTREPTTRFWNNKGWCDNLEIVGVFKNLNKIYDFNPQPR